MIKRIATVGGLTLISRASGFIRDVVMAAVLGAGPTADAFFVAFRLPNHFRAIFAEGAFAAAFVPAYARTLQQSGTGAAKLFADSVAAALVVINLVLLTLALLFTPWVVRTLAPGLVNDPLRFDLVAAFTRITFPYLTLVSFETLLAGVLNANERFAAAAGAPIFFNISLIATLLLAPYFQSAGYAAAWGVLIAGVAQVMLVATDAEMRGVGIRFRMPTLDAPILRFLKALGPAIIGAGGVQLALLADTLIASFCLAFATSIGAWINLSLLTIFARRRGFAMSGAGLRPVISLLLAGVGLATTLYFGSLLLSHAFAGIRHFREEITLAVLLVIGVVFYIALVALLLGRGWLRNLFKDVGTAEEARQMKLLTPLDPTEASAALPNNQPPPTV